MESCNRGKLLLKTAFCLGSNRYNVQSVMRYALFVFQRGTKKCPEKSVDGKKWRNVSLSRGFSRFFCQGKKERSNSYIISYIILLKLSTCNLLVSPPFSLFAHRLPLSRSKDAQRDISTCNAPPPTSYPLDKFPVRAVRRDQ